AIRVRVSLLKKRRCIQGVEQQAGKSLACNEGDDLSEDELLPGPLSDIDAARTRPSGIFLEQCRRIDPVVESVRYPDLAEAEVGAHARASLGDGVDGAIEQMVEYDEIIGREHLFVGALAVEC